jgi:hypothetical protein
MTNQFNVKDLDNFHVLTSTRKFIALWERANREVRERYKTDFT